MERRRRVVYGRRYLGFEQFPKFAGLIHNSLHWACILFRLLTHFYFICVFVWVGESEIVTRGSGFLFIVGFWGLSFLLSFLCSYDGLFGSFIRGLLIDWRHCGYFCNFFPFYLHIWLLCLRSEGGGVILNG